MDARYSRYETYHRGPSWHQRLLYGCQCCEASDLETNLFSLPHTILNQLWELETIEAFRKKAGYSYPLVRGKPVNRKSKEGTGKHSRAPRFIGRRGQQSSIGPYCFGFRHISSIRRTSLCLGRIKLVKFSFQQGLFLLMPVSLELPSM